MRSSNKLNFIFRFGKKMESAAFLSNAQAKLEAIMSKMTDILPFITDEDCEKAFAVLSSVAQATLDQRSTAKAASFSKMSLIDLVMLAKPSDQGEQKLEIAH